MKAYRKIKSANPDIEALQQQLEQVLNPIVRVAMLSGVQLTDVAVTTAGVQLEHGLGRQPLGWFITDLDTGVHVWRTAWDKFTLTLDASGSATINLWVY